MSHLTTYIFDPSSSRSLLCTLFFHLYCQAAVHILHTNYQDLIFTTEYCSSIDIYKYTFSVLVERLRLLVHSSLKCDWVFGCEVFVNYWTLSHCWEISTWFCVWSWKSYTEHFAFVCLTVGMNNIDLGLLLLCCHAFYRAIRLAKYYAALYMSSYLPVGMK